MIKVHVPRSKKVIIGTTFAILLLCAFAAWYAIQQSTHGPQHAGAPQSTAISTTAQTPAVTSSPSPTPSTKTTTLTSPSPTPVTPSAQTISDPASLEVVVNKKRALPSNYVPAGLTSVGTTLLRPEAADAIRKLVADAEQAQLALRYVSGYRSYTTQTSVYSSYVRSDGQANADTYSARPGFSEHQTGLAIDMGNADGSCELQICFGDTSAGKWLAAHAHEYGFIIRYPPGKTSITGYQYEPWHLRFIGGNAEKIQQSGNTLEEYYATGAAPTY